MSVVCHMHSSPWACSRRMVCCTLAVLSMAVCSALSYMRTTHSRAAQELGGQPVGHVCSASSTVFTVPSASSHVLRHGTVAVTEAVGPVQNNPWWSRGKSQLETLSSVSHPSACALHGSQTCASAWAARACDAHGLRRLQRFNALLGAPPPNGRCDSVAVSLCGSCNRPPDRATAHQGKVALCLSNRKPLPAPVDPRPL